MDTAGLVARVCLSLGAVMGLIWLTAVILRGRTGARNATVLEVVARQPLSKHACVTMVRLGDKGILLGVTEEHVSVLGETELPAPEQPARRRGRMLAHKSVESTIAIKSAPGLRAVPALGVRQDIANAQPDLDDVLAATGTDGTVDTLRNAARPSALHGSILSPATWRQTVDALRERTVRR